MAWTGAEPTVANRPFVDCAVQRDTCISGTSIGDWSVGDWKPTMSKSYSERLADVDRAANTVFVEAVAPVGAAVPGSVPSVDLSNASAGRRPLLRRAQDGRIAFWRRQGRNRSHHLDSASRAPASSNGSLAVG